MSSGAEEFAQVWLDVPRKARKAHTCDACGEAILPGHRYVYHTSIYDGSVHHVKRCAICEAIYRHLFEKPGRDFEDQPMPALDCGHTYQEIHGVEPPEEIARLAFMTQEEMQRELANK